MRQRHQGATITVCSSKCMSHLNVKEKKNSANNSLLAINNVWDPEPSQAFLPSPSTLLPTSSPPTPIATVNQAFKNKLLRSFCPLRHFTCRTPSLLVLFSSHYLLPVPGWHNSSSEKAAPTQKLGSSFLWVYSPLCTQTSSGSIPVLSFSAAFLSIFSTPLVTNFCKARLVSYSSCWLPQRLRTVKVQSFLSFN